MRTALLQLNSSDDPAATLPVTQQRQTKLDRCTDGLVTRNGASKLQPIQDDAVGSIQTAAGKLIIQIKLELATVHAVSQVTAKIR